MSRSSQFPPLEWLGYGLDLTRIDPFNFFPVPSEKTTPVRIVDVTKDTRTQTVTIGDVEYEVPQVVAASDASDTQGFQRTFSDGALVVKTLQDDAALAYRLLPVTTSNISHFPLDKSLPTKNQFFFFNNDHDAFSGRLRDYLDFIDEEKILNYVSNLPPFDSDNPEAVQAYEDFFNTVGSHFVVSASYGARFQLEVWALNKYEELNKNFTRDVTASVQGLNAGGEYDKSVFGESQYLDFQRLSQRIVRILGGDSDLADALVKSPDFPMFQKWTESVSSNPDLVAFKASELWSLLRDAKDKTLRDSASHLQNAFEYISSLRNSLPNDKHTWVVFETESNWGEFGIMTPSAVIGGGDSDQGALPRTLALGPAKLHWGSQDSPSQHVVAVVDVINDGTPIDIYISSGSGTASVRILGRDYDTQGGTHWYPSVTVSV